jgi:EAL domain-containing protein (putative c-di-GMP-specific phosphodiesterase class I)
MRNEREWTVLINQAIEAKRFHLYQQKIEPTSLEKVSSVPSHYEILLRMISPEEKILSPLAFIPAAERYGLMSKIDRLVVEMLFEFLEKNPQAQENYYTVNLSGATIGDEKFLELLIDLFSRSRMSPQSICFEITETAAITNFNQAIKFIKKLKNIGCEFALDDFGTGMSSFSYLKILPVNYIKIDGNFIKDILTDELDYTIVKSIEQAAQVLKIKTIAEYVETQEIRSKLEEMGIDYVQGYGVAKVFPLDDLL